MFNRVDTIEANTFRLVKLDSFIHRLLLEHYKAVKWVRPGTHRALDPPFAIRFDYKGTCTVLGVLRVTFRCQSGKPVIISIMSFGTRALCFD